MFKKIEELLKAGQLNQSVANELDTLITTELKSLKDESTSWKLKYEDLNTKFESISKTKDDLEVKLSSIDEQIKKAKEDGKAELANELEAYKKTQEELKTNLESIQNENKNLSIKNGLQSELSKYKVIDNEVVMSVLKEKVSLNEDGSLSISIADGKASLEDGIKSFFDSKPHLLSVQGNNGSGSQNNSFSGGLDKSKMSDSDRFEFIKKHGADAYKNLK